jgi:hypothetical protein
MGHRRIGKGRAAFQRIDDCLLSGNPRFKRQYVPLGLCYSRVRTVRHRDSVANSMRRCFCSIANARITQAWRCATCKMAAALTAASRNRARAVAAEAMSRWLRAISWSNESICLSLS